MSPNSLPGRKYSGKICLPHIEAERGVRKAGEDEWED